MRITEGGFYRTRDGRKAHVTDKTTVSGLWYGWVDGCSAYWNLDGSVSPNCSNPSDLVAEWSDETAKPELPKFDVEKLRKVWLGNGRCSVEVALLAVANYARDITLNPPKNPVEVLAEKIGALWLDFTNEADAASIVARHILETYPDAHERL